MAEWLCCSEKKCLPNHKCCGLGFYSPCYILFLTCKSPKSQSPHEVLVESSWSPHRVLDQSQWDCKGTPGGVPPLWGLYRESFRTPWGLLRDSLRTPWDSPATCG